MKVPEGKERPKPRSCITVGKGIYVRSAPTFPVCPRVKSRTVEAWQWETDADMAASVQLTGRILNYLPEDKHVVEMC